MICKGCGKALAENEPRRMVAQWPFCEPCFQELLDRGSSSEQARPLPSEQKEDPACSLCGAVGVGKVHKVGFWFFCDPCHADLASPLLPKAGMAPDGEIEDEQGNTEVENQPTGPDPRTIINCSGCGRRIPLGGSRELNGCLYCPECSVATGFSFETRHGE